MIEDLGESLSAIFGDLYIVHQKKQRKASPESSPAA